MKFYSIIITHFCNLLEENNSSEYIVLMDNKCSDYANHAVFSTPIKNTRYFLYH